MSLVRFKNAALRGSKEELREIQGGPKLLEISLRIFKRILVSRTVEH